MPLYQIRYAPEGRVLGNEYGDNPSHARKRFARINPKYKRTLGELGCTEILVEYRSNALYLVQILASGAINIFGTYGDLQEIWSHGAWLENGRVFDHVKANALRTRALLGTVL